MKKVFALIALAIVMCCCNNNQPQKNEKPEKTSQEVTVEKSYQEQYPEKFTGIYIVEHALGFLVDVPEPKTVESVAIVDGNIAKVKIKHLDTSHEVIMKFDNGEWVLGEIKSSN